MQELLLVAKSLQSCPTLCDPIDGMQETWVQFLDQKDPLEKEMATHSSTLAWEIPCTEEPGRLQSMQLQELDTKSDKPPPPRW